MLEGCGVRQTDDLEKAELTQQTNFVFSCKKDFRLNDQNTAFRILGLV